MKYAVTGATGFIGGRVVQQLLAAGHTVHALVRDPDRARDLEQRGVRLFKGDVTDAPSLAAPLQGVDGIFHLAAWYEIGTKNRARAEDINIQGTRNVLTTMRDLGIPKGVYTSSVAVFSDTHGELMDESYRRGGPWLTLYDRTKWRAHYEIAEPMIRDGLPLVIAQPGLVYGPGDQSIVHRTLLQYLRGKLHVAPQATAYCFGYVDDIATGHLLAMQKGRVGESYIFAGPLHTFIELFALCERLTGVKQPRFNPSPTLMKVLAQTMRVAGTFASLPENYRYESLRVMAGVTYGGNDAKARRELGWTCRDIESGMRPTLTAYLRELGMPLPPQLQPAAGIDVELNRRGVR